MKKKVIKTIILTILLIGIDLISKFFFFDKNLLGNLSIINPTFNTGISRGIEANMILILTVSILAIFIFLYLFQKKQIGWIILSILMAGTLGNLIDRILLGGVRDFISIGNFPVFNIADILLNIGIILVLFKEFGTKNYNKN